MGTLIFFDLETGGLKWWPHRLAGRLIPMNPIIQIAAIAVDEKTFTELEVHEQKIAFNPEHADPEALGMNSYEERLWKKEAVSEEVARLAFDRFLRRHASVQKISRRGDPYQIASLAGHNAAAFDLPFLRTWFERAELFLPAAFQVLDTMILARIYASVTGRQFDNYKLSTICEALGVAPGTHDALADVRATTEIAQELLRALRWNWLGLSGGPQQWLPSGSVSSHESPARFLLQ